MIKKIKVVTVIGTRPEIIRLSRVICALDSSSSIHHILIHTGQNYDYELNQIFFDELGLRKPDYFLDISGLSPSKTIGNILIKIDDILDNLNPDALLVLGDTNSCLSAIVAKKKQIPIFHMEAGNRCFDYRVPEESNRRIVDHIADINLTYSDIAREYLLKEGIFPDRIIKTGSPMFEVINFYEKQIFNSNVIDRLSLKNSEYFVISAHREENINNDINFSNLINSLNVLALKYDFPIIFSTHPRTKKRIEDSNIKLNSKIIILKPLGFIDYCALQVGSFAVLSDSGTISEESSILNFRALNIREAHERPEAMEETSVMMVGLNSDRILQGLVQLSKQNIGSNRDFYLVKDYSIGNVSEKVVRIIISYIDYVNRFVWRKM